MDVFEEMVELGRSLGYSDEQARVLATGRAGSERAAREVWEVPAPSCPAPGAPVSESPVEEFHQAMAEAVTATVAGAGLGLTAARRRVAELVGRMAPDTTVAERAAALRREADRAFAAAGLIPPRRSRA